MMTKQKELNTRQWTLYNYLKDHSDRFINLKDIYFDLFDYYPLVSKEKFFNNTHARRIMSDDITALKSSGVIQTIIISTSRGIKLATKEEYLKYLDKEEISLKKRLKIVSKQRKKARLDNQNRVVFAQEKPIFESFAKIG